MVASSVAVKIDFFFFSGLLHLLCARDRRRPHSRREGRRDRKRKRGRLRVQGGVPRFRLRGAGAGLGQRGEQ